MSVLVKRARAAYHLIDTDHTGLIEELADEIERLRIDVKIEWDCGVAVGKKQVLDDMRESLPEHPPLRGPIAAFLDAYEEARK